MYKILITDDDEDDHFLLTEAFNEQIKHTIIHLYDGQQLIDYLKDQGSLKQKFPDLILLDINMPKIDGFKALEFIKSESAFKAIPILMYSTTGDKKQMKRCSEMGANGFVSKVWTLTEMASFVKDINSFLFESVGDPSKQFVHNIKPGNSLN